MLNNSGKINILVVIIIILVQCIIAGVAWFLFFREPQPEPQPRLQTLERTEVQQSGRQRVEPTASRLNTDQHQGFVDHQNFEIGGKDYLRTYALFTLNDITINLAGPESRFLVVGVTLEYRQADRRLPDELKNKTAIFNDRLINYFSRLTIEVVRNHENRDIFKDDIMSIINGQLLEGRITNVLFEKFVFQ
jgi:flagellar basal body-associated protein FliL